MSRRDDLEQAIAEIRAEPACCNALRLQADHPFAQRDASDKRQAPDPRRTLIARLEKRRSSMNGTTL